MTIISYAAIKDISTGEEKCPHCHKELTIEDFPPYEYDGGGGGQGNILVCTKCGYSATILYD